MAKRYYWLKLPDDFFRQKPIKKLRKIAGGDTYTIIYLKMLLIAMKQDGRLYFDGVEDDFYDDLALDLDEDTENVKVTVLFLVRQGLMELVDDSEYLLTEVENMTGSETASTKRSRACRARQKEQKALQCNTTATVAQQPFSNCNVEKEIEIEKEIEKEKDKTLCPEVVTSRQEQIFISLPLVTGSGSYDVTFDYLNSLRELYPAVDVEQEFRKMYGWLDSNPTNRKTKKGIKRFITGWLARAQDRAPTSKPAASNRNMSTGQYMESTAGWYLND